MGPHLAGKLPIPCLMLVADVGHFAIHDHRATLIAGNLDLQLPGQSPLLPSARPGLEIGVSAAAPPIVISQPSLASRTRALLPRLWSSKRSSHLPPPGCW